MLVRILLAFALAAAAPLAAAGPTPSPVAPGPSPVPPPAATPAPPPAPTPPAAPAAEGRKAAFVLELGGDFGSNKFFEVTFEDGSKQTMAFNDGFFMNFGAAFLRVPLTADLAIDTSATVGFKYKSIGADNGSYRYLAFPVEVTERLTLGPIRFGLGASLALNPSYEGDGLAEGADIDLDNSLGIVGRLEWVGLRSIDPRQGWIVGVRLLFQKFGNAGGVESGNSVGFVLGAEL